jgi:hypothetical protein
MFGPLDRREDRRMFGPLDRREEDEEDFEPPTKTV